MEVKPKRKDTRKGDRHKYPNQDRHKDVKKDRHKVKKDRHKNPNKDRHKSKVDRHKGRKLFDTNWTGEFVAIDGEGWNGKYTLLACSAKEDDIYNPRGLSTLECLQYLCDDDIPYNAAWVGFGLNYDFENILRDIPDQDYLLLREGQEVEYKGYHIRYIPRKILEIRWNTGRTRENGSPVYRSIFIQDVFGFFQSSFEGALKKWEIPIPPIITEMKQKRSKFGVRQISEIKRYNRTELALLIELMEKLRQADREAFLAIGLFPKHNARIWYGPGSRAANFLTQTFFNQEHPPFSGLVYKRLQKMTGIEDYPFSAAFYGGRIEAAMIGEYRGKLYDYDINSAYPYALANLPKWKPDDLVITKGLDPQKRIGMYYVEWALPQSNFYPFPFRGQNDNVYFPSIGSGWYMSPEVHAALSIYPKGIKIIRGFVLDGTDGAGDGIGKLPPEKICTTGHYIQKMADVRLKAKREKLTYEKVLKLVMNSCYGKTIQQVGSHRFLNPFVAAWITSVCRSKLVLVMGRDTQNNIISCMTDGILSKIPLDVELGKELGQFEMQEFDRVLQFLPGVYYLSNSETGEEIYRYRGMSKNFNPEKAIRSLYDSKPYHITLKVFVTRSLSIAQHNVYGDKRYYFVEVEKDEHFSLSSKREPRTNGFTLRRGERNAFFRPKAIDPLHRIFGSKPYTVNVEPVEKEYDEARSMEELLDANHIGSVIQDAIINEG